MPFLSPLTVQEDSDREGYWVLTSDLEYMGDKEPFVVPAGFRTDFASVPRLFTWLVPNTGEYTKAAVLHDWLCSQHAVPRRDADGVFRRTMRELGVSDLRRYVMWGAVRLASMMRGATPGDWLLVLLMAAFVLPLAVPATLLVLAGLVLMFVAEVVVWVVGRLLGRHPARPRHFWWN